MNLETSFTLWINDERVYICYDQNDMIYFINYHKNTVEIYDVWCAFEYEYVNAAEEFEYIAPDIYDLSITDLQDMNYSEEAIEKIKEYGRSKGLFFRD